jgi:hypothetical protein
MVGRVDDCSGISAIYFHFAGPDAQGLLRHWVHMEAVLVQLDDAAGTSWSQRIVKMGF